MTRLREILLTVATAGLLYLPVLLLLVPPPIPSLTIVLGGLVVACVSGPRRPVPTSLGALGGLAVGAVLHARSHIVEGRADPRAEFVQHVALDAGLSLLIAVPILALTLAVQARVAGTRA